ncbi:hypothetical protein [Amycolatopsis japonica]|uniref:hypothetical protein n=1 Tax=Amycolatopsis japonica TaxID=208439 RepID=UPI00378862DA
MFTPISRTELRERLDHALAEGPFERALSLAIDLSGLALARLKKRLEDAGSPVSITTLSYWRAGRTRPERPASLRAVPALEAALGLPTGSLTRLLDADPNPKTQPATEFVRWDRLWDRQSLVVPVLHTFEASYENSLVAESVHDTLHVDGDRLLRRAHVREVLRAREDQAQVKIVTMKGGGPGRPPKLTATRYCHPGRVETRSEDGFTVAELIVDEWLSQGETTIVEYEFEYTDVVPDTGFDRRFRHTIPSYLLEVHFTPGALPASCFSYWMVSPTSARQEVTPIPLTSEAPAHVVRTALPAGICGMNWSWE